MGGWVGGRGVGGVAPKAKSPQLKMGGWVGGLVGGWWERSAAWDKYYPPLVLFSVIRVRFHVESFITWAILVF